MKASRQVLGCVLAIVVGTACREPRPTTQDRAVGEAPNAVVVPGAWAALGVPTAGLVRVLPGSDEHGFYADYAGHDRDALLALVTNGLTAAGFTRSCTAVQGMVIGFSRGERRLAVKIDVFDVLALSVFDEWGNEPLLHGLCFGRYREGRWHRLSQKEKEELARRLEVEDGGQSPSPRPQRPQQ